MKARDVLDIGCGTENLVDRLRARVDRVTGIEPDSATALVAAARFAGDDSVVIEQVRFDQLRLPRQWGPTGRRDDRVNHGTARNADRDPLCGS
ncbi:methyltransferase domain-containing protein [Nocardia fluminea]|uniref:methyltransferase domain-containing protein n=1 Tax=Nocardia fluminea TaxID=134984 RepID=UPI00380B9E34